MSGALESCRKLLAEIVKASWPASITRAAMIQERGPRPASKAQAFRLRAFWS